MLVKKAGLAGWSNCLPLAIFGFTLRLDQRPQATVHMQRLFMDKPNLQEMRMRTLRFLETIMNNS